MASYKRIIRQYNKYLITLVFIMIAVGSIVLWFIPSFSSLYTRFTSIQTEKKEVTQLERKASFLSSLDEAGLDNSVSVLTSALPAESLYPTILMLVDALVQQQGLSIGGFSVSGGTIDSSASAGVRRKSSSSDKAFTVPFEFSLKGPLDKIRTVLEQSLTIRRLVRFDTLSVGLGVGSASESGDLTTSITASVFYQPLPTTMGSIKDLLPEISMAEQDILSKIAQYPDFSYGVNQQQSQLVPMYDEKRINPFVP